MKITNLITAATLLIYPCLTLANIQSAPPNFDINKGGGRAVFVDFTKADYEIAFDIAQKQARLKSTIQFNAEESGFPIFDLIDEPGLVSLDGKPVGSELISSPVLNGEVTKFRIAKGEVTPGKHTLVIIHILKNYAPKFTAGSVSSGFFMSDLDSRGLLERYLPANMEYDQVEMQFEVEVLGAAEEHIIFSNGQQTQTSPAKWTIKFPSFYNSGSIYFHIRPATNTRIERFSYTSADKRTLPAVVYMTEVMRNDLNEYKAEIISSLQKFERLFGPFPHESVVVYATERESGGMEYAGATVTNMWALPHELAHSYYGRGVMPANGNAGWIDEAMATLVGGPYLPNPDAIQPTNMSGHSPYFRQNDSNGYYQGMNFLAYLDLVFGEKNDALTIKGFLKAWTEMVSKQIATTDHLQKSLEAYAEINLDELFQKHVYGKEIKSKTSPLTLPNPHMNPSPQTLQALQ